MTGSAADTEYLRGLNDEQFEFEARRRYRRSREWPQDMGYYGDWLGVQAVAIETGRLAIVQRVQAQVKAEREGARAKQDAAIASGKGVAR